jgi:arylsulfatase A-like enzyme
MWRKIFPYQGSVRIPLIIRMPETMIQTGNTTKGFRKENTPVTLMDIMPTVLKAAGIEVPDNVEGIDILGPLCGEPIQGREFIHGEHTCGDLFGTQYLTDGKYKYCYDTVSGSEQLFNLESDPDELVNLAVKEKHGETLEKWRKRLIEIFEKRPEDGLVENGRLVSGRELFPVGLDLTHKSEAVEFHPNARNRIEEHYGKEAFKKQDGFEN